MRLTNQRSIIPEEITELEVVKDLLTIFNNKEEERIGEEKQINKKAYNWFKDNLWISLRMIVFY